ncbi:MAG TPA: PVC-type heme-binding CxxCH protein [Tepidisphaeraceae bacterium]|nr:PVC-type heme-binding CxxCH protein [Tepidisphaeraceae bacterium]
MGQRSAFLVTVLAITSSVSAATFKVDNRTFTLPDGFSIEKIAGPPLVDRPITADFDEQGNLYISDSSGTTVPLTKQLAEKPHRIVKLTDTDGDGKFDKQTIYADKMMFPEGTMWLKGSLYVSAPPSIWKLTDTNNDGIADQRSEWFQGKTLTGCGNDLHGPYLGPDGWIYWCKGAFAEQTYTLPGDRQFKTKASHIFRARPDGSRIEPVMTGGMDNPVDCVFTSTGERIFTTTFFQHPGGGQRDGLIHAIYGGVYGKVHAVLDNHPRTSPDVMPVLTHLGPAAPSGLHRYQSDSLGPEFKDNLFSACFNLRKIVRHILTPAGATFTSKDEEFLTCDSLDFHPTDVFEDADGSLIVIDTGGWYKLCCPTSQLHKPDLLGAVYRIRKTDAPKVNDPRGLAIAWDKIPNDELAKLLDDPRPAVRRRAMETLPESREDGLNSARRVAYNSESRRSRINAIWAESHCTDGNSVRMAIRALKDPDENVRHAAIHSISVWRDSAAVPELIKLLADPSLQVRRATAEALGRLGDPAAIPAILGALKEKESAERALEHSLIFALIELAKPKETSAGLASDNIRVKKAALIALDQMPGEGNLKPESIVEALSSSEPILRDTAAWIAGRHPEWGASLATSFEKQMRTPQESADDRARLREQLAKLAKSPDIQNLLASRAHDESATTGERILALDAMRESGLKDTPQPWLDTLTSILKSTDPTLIPAAVSTTRALPIKKESAATLAPMLAAVAARADLPRGTRLSAVAALPPNSTELAPDVFNFLLSQFSPAQPVSTRLLAADALLRAKLNADQLKELFNPIKSSGPLELDRILAAFEKSTDPAIGSALLAALKDAKALKSLAPDSIRRHLAKYPDEVKKQSEELIATLNPDSSKQKAHLEELLTSLPPGEIRRGQLLFTSEKAACYTCHAIGYLGGAVGPDLTRIGTIRQERDLLESIVYPSASFTQSYAPVIVDTTDNDRQVGILKKDDPEEILLLTGPNAELRIPRSKIKGIRPSPLSLMPEGLEQLITKQDLADLLAFLKACK